MFKSIARVFLFSAGVLGTQRAPKRFPESESELVIEVTEQKRSCKRSEGHLAAESILLQSLIRNPKTSVDEIFVQIETLGVSITYRDLEMKYEKYLQLTWVSDQQHMTLMSLVDPDPSKSVPAKKRLERILKSGTELEKKRLNIWSEYCIQQLLSGISAADPCYPEPSPWLGEENVQWTLSEANIARVLEVELKFVLERRQKEKRHRSCQESERGYMKQARPCPRDEITQHIADFVERQPDADIEAVKASLEADGFHIALSTIEQLILEQNHDDSRRDWDADESDFRGKKKRSYSTGEIQRAVFENLSMNPTADPETIAALLAQGGMFVETSLIESIITEVGLNISVPRWLHELLVDIPHDVDEDFIEFMVTLRQLEDETITAEEIKAQLLNASKWIEWCIATKRPHDEPTGCFANTFDEWVLTDQRKAELYAALI